MSVTYDFSGKTALVTGGSAGMGEATVRAFAEAAANVAIVDRDAAAALRLADELSAALPLPFPMGDGEAPVASWRLLLERVLDQARKGYEVQRYKGLGEMNPEQLWETTMDPARRILLQVTIDDAAQADEMFSVLMGEDVESRRSFIQQNARDVRFLDI